MEKENILIFVYGTLRVGGSHHHLLGEATVINKSYSLPGHCMYSAGWYPVVVADQDSPHQVVGDIIGIQADLIPKLDVYEGNEFSRKLIEIPQLKQPVWVYVLKDSEDVSSYKAVPGGDWLEAVRSAN
ncbi:MAG: gamma-glutamylcyclotransferase family protein [Cyclobacteriaceae bacterium]